MQRSQLLDAVRRLAREERGEVTVSLVLKRVGCGRNTFYEHFDNLDIAVGEACGHSSGILESSILAALRSEEPCTPNDLIWAVAVIWADWTGLDGGGHWALLDRYARHTLDDVLRRVVFEIHHNVVQSGGASGLLEPMRADAAVGALCAIARGVHERRLVDGTMESEKLAAACHEVLVRLLR